jgi:TonB family protein
VRAFALFFMLSSTVPQAAPPPPPPPPPPLAAATFGAAHTCPSGVYYPPQAVQANEEGDTTVAFVITAEGTVAGVWLANSSGHADLDAAAMLCVNTWHYHPAMMNGFPVAVRWRAVIKWRMDSFDPAIGNLFLAGYACTQNPPLDGDDKAKVRRPTVLQINFAGGMIAGVLVTESSGSERLDTRAATCFASLSPELTKHVSDVPFLVIPIVWKRD